MKKNLFTALAVIASVLIVFIFAINASANLNNVVNTKHNLSPTGVGTVKATSGQNNNEICVYCHTPHNNDGEYMPGAPLSNRGEGGSGYMFRPGTENIGIGSNLCLSCHDGVSAVNSLVKVRGIKQTQPVAFSTATAGQVFKMTTNIIGRENGGAVDLSAHHPVGVEWNANKPTLKDISSQLTGWIGVDGDISSLLAKTGGRVECVSCHVSHSDANGFFLRKNNAASALCLGCHTGL